MSSYQHNFSFWFKLNSPAGPFTPEVVGTAALYAGQSILMFGFAAVVIEVGKLY